GEMDETGLEQGALRKDFVHHAPQYGKKSLPDKQASKPCQHGSPSLSSVDGAGKRGGLPVLPELVPLPLIRRLALVLLLALASLGRAEANPMLLVDMETLDVLHAEEAGQP